MSEIPVIKLLRFIDKPRLHSSRMCTSRALTVSPSMLCAGGVSSLGGSPLGEGGLLWERGVSSGGGGLLWGRGVSSRGVSSGGSPPGGVVVSQHALRQTPPVNRMTNRCKNITLPQTSFAGGNRQVAPKMDCNPNWSNAIG